MGGLVAVVCVAAIAFANAPARGDRLQPRLVREVRTGLRLAQTDFGWRGWLAPRRGARRWAPIWETVHVLDAASGLAAATRLPADRSRLAAIARAAEGYWNPRLAGGVGGYSSNYRGVNPRTQNWFDDNGWLGLAFLTAYDVTHDGRYLRDAKRALAYMLAAGWDSRSGGIWWTTAHDFKAAESNVTAAALAARLHDETGDHAYLRAAQSVVDWTNANLFDAGTGLYVNRRPDGVPMSYLQSPMIDALARLCRSDGLYCRRLHALVEATLARFRVVRQGPPFDAMYVRFLVDALQIVHDRRFVDVARRNALRALDRARDADGLYIHDWDGGSRGARPGALQTHAATLEALAWTASAIELRLG